MRVLAINQFYAPDLSAGSQILTELCEDLVSTGDEVTVVASRGTYLGGELLPSRETLRGVQVIRAFATSYGKSSMLGRISDYATFWMSAVAAGMREASPDVVLAVTTPPMIAAAASLVARARGVPLVSWTQDVYPEVAVEFGVMRKGGVAEQFFLKLQRWTHQASRRIVVISAGMGERLIAQGAARDRVRVAHNWCDGSFIEPRLPEENVFRREQGLRDFVVMYSGNFGVAHDFEPLVMAARLLEGRRSDISFLFIGDGRRKAEAVAMASGLRNVRFLPYQPRELLNESLTAADAHLICLRDGLDGLVVPSKIYSAMACARPVFYVGPRNCEVAQLIRRAEIGWAGEPSDSAGLADAIQRAATDKAWSGECGRRARVLFEAEYDRPHAVANWRRILHEVHAPI